MLLTPALLAILATQDVQDQVSKVPS